MTIIFVAATKEFFQAFLVLLPHTLYPAGCYTLSLVAVGQYK
jgi:hypothetical protein